MTLEPTPGQTVGPFFHDALPFTGDADLVNDGHPSRIRLSGTVFDGARSPVADALVEIWQADQNGHVPNDPGSLHRDGHTFTGWGRAQTDREGRYTFSTVAPGAVVGSTAPAFFSVCVFARGLLDRLVTRAYLPGADLDSDPLLSSLSPDERASLVAVEDAAGYRFDIHLQGDLETVFLSHDHHE